MIEAPFVLLEKPRVVNAPGMPEDLAAFYRTHEGVGLGRDWDNYQLLFSTLSEAVPVDWGGVDWTDVPEGWEEFRGILIARGPFGHKIVYVLNAPSCQKGSILAIGTSLPGPGGTGPYALESSFVLAHTFNDWLAHLKRWKWEEAAVSGCADYSDPTPEEVHRYYFPLNPDMNVPKKRSLDE